MNNCKIILFIVAGLLFLFCEDEKPLEGPVAVIVISYSPENMEAPLDASFTSSFSIPGDGDINKWEWRINSQEQLIGEQILTTQDAQFNFLKYGIYEITLTIWDDNDLSDTTTLEIEVEKETCPLFSDPVDVGALPNLQLNEISGIVASRKNPGIFWVHNDSGDSARIFAIEENGTLKGTFNLPEVSAVDWEDIAIGPGPEADEHYIYIGDFGDNFSDRNTVLIRRFKEPEVSASGSPEIKNIDNSEFLIVKYSDGPHNAETLLSDPITGNLYIITKSDDGLSQVLELPFPHSTQEVLIPDEIATLQFGQDLLPGNLTTTGGDISTLGNQIIIRTYSNAFVWIRHGSVTIKEAFEGDPCSVPLASEIQGESICYSADGKYYLSLTEFENMNNFENQSIYRYNKL